MPLVNRCAQIFTGKTVTKSPFEKVVYPFILVLLSIFVVIFFYNSLIATGGDFPVFWHAGRHYMSGKKLYDFSRDGVQCYKYPPWVTVLFLPFSTLSLSIANMAWRVFLVFCMIFSLIWTVDKTSRPYIAFGVFFNFWGVWMYNLIQGQVTPALLFMALVGYSVSQRKTPWGSLVLIFALSAKIFNLVSLFGFNRRHWDKKTLIPVVICFCIFSLPALMGTEYWNPIQLFHDFVSTSSVSSDNLGGANYGLPSIWIALFSFFGYSSLFYSRMIGFFLSFILLIFCSKFFRCSRAFNYEHFAVWLALGTSIHPLLFSYGFTWVFPLAVFALDRAINVTGYKKWWLVFGALIGLTGVTVLDRILFKFFYNLPVRSISTWFLACVWKLSIRANPINPEFE